MKNVIHKMTTFLLALAMCESLCIGSDVCAQGIDEEGFSQKVEVADCSEHMMSTSATDS